MKPFDPTKPVQTRDGRKARILATDLLGAYPIVSAIRISDDPSLDSVCSHTRNGAYVSDNTLEDFDLVNLPETKRVELTVYKDKISGLLCALEIPALLSTRGDFTELTRITVEVPV